ncbi:S8 family serine peptidase [Clostridium tyrobutyricum]|uniref:S8 family serine peptidase n=1 Tax=Clostridium tyrobutyricum TaxID=1519 RepID=UPI00241C5F25|nr:S8 family serine peptidase [Clostridium tyrobutyricum]
MKKKILSLLAGIFIILGLFQNVSASTYKDQLKMNTSRYIVTVSSKQDISKIKSSIPKAEVKDLSNGQAVVYSEDISKNTLKKDLSKVKNIRSIRNPVKMKIDGYSRKMNVNSARSLEWDIPDVMADSAWSNISQKKTVKIAVVDTGVDYNNSLLKGKIDVSDGYNFISNNSNAMDDSGHGTGVTGIIATNSNVKGKDLIGVTGNLNVEIIPVKVLDSSGTGDSDIIAEGIQYAADKGADIINLSFGGKGSAPEIDSAIQYAKSKGSFVVAAAGNDNADVKDYSPASNSNVFTVSALNMRNSKSYYSNYGYNVQGAAPGDNILSVELNNQYYFMTGTSMASPIVSSVAAMVKAANPNLNSTQIAQILDESTDKIGTQHRNIYYGYGKINAVKAVKQAVAK